MYKKLKGWIKCIIPSYAIVPLLFCLVFNYVIYLTTGIIAEQWKHYDFTLPFDRAVPIIPEFMIIYFGCYLFWVINYIVIGRQGKEHCVRFAVSDILSRLICGILFLVIPTTNIRPIIEGNGFSEMLLRWLYEIDPAVNLFPSIHCMISWFCYIGLRKLTNIPKYYKIFSCIFAILVFISTQVTKQHYVVDIIGAVVIAEITFFIGFHTNLYKYASKIFDPITHFIFRGRVDSAVERKKIGE